MGQESRYRPIEQLKLDQSVITEMEYLNILPDMSRFNDVNETSFLKSLNQTVILKEEEVRIKEL